MPDHNLLEEYRDLGENLRHYGDMRLRQLTLFALLTGAIVTVLSGENKISHWEEMGFKVIGLFVAAAFLIMEARSSAYWRGFRQRAMEIEREFGFRQYSGTPSRSILSGTFAIRLLYSVVIVFWILTLFVPRFSL